MQSDIIGISITDYETIENIKYVLKNYKYLIDPHTSVGFSALKKYKKDNNCIGIVLSTAHPAKFPKIMNELNINYEIPDQLKLIQKKNIYKKRIDNDYFLL